VRSRRTGGAVTLHPAASGNESHLLRHGLVYLLDLRTGRLFLRGVSDQGLLLASSVLIVLSLDDASRATAPLPAKRGGAASLPARPGKGRRPRERRAGIARPPSRPAALGDGRRA
jgi:hypothetical protein